MSTEDVAAARPYLSADVDLVVNVCASFSDATPALELYADLDRPVLLWAFREPGPVGDRLWLNSLCGANLFGHALVVHAGREPRLLYGDPDEPATRAPLADALAGRPRRHAVPPCAQPLPAAVHQRGIRRHPRPHRPGTADLGAQRMGRVAPLPRPVGR